MPDREHMTDDRGETGGVRNGHGVGKRGGERHGREAFERIPDQHDRRRLLPQRAEYVGRAGVAAAVLVDVDAHEPGNDHAEVDRADQIRQDEGENGVHRRGV